MLFSAIVPLFPVVEDIVDVAVYGDPFVIVVLEQALALYLVV